MAVWKLLSGSLCKCVPKDWINQYFSCTMLKACAQISISKRFRESDLAEVRIKLPHTLATPELWSKDIVTRLEVYTDMNAYSLERYSKFSEFPNSQVEISSRNKQILWFTKT